MTRLSAIGRSPLRRLAVAALPLALLTTAAGAQADRATEFVRQGRQLNNSGKLPEALAAYQEALALKPDLYAAHAGMGVTLDLLGRYDEARTHLKHAIELASPDQKVSALRSMAMSYLFDRKGAEAIPFGQQAVDLVVATGDYNLAGEVTNEIARVLLESDRLDDANRWYTKGYEYATRQATLSDSARDLWDFRLENARARIAARRGDAKSAAQHVAAAQKAFARGRIPDQAPYVPYLTGYVAFYLKDYRTAITDLSAANQRDPFILALLAQSYEHTGDTAKARELWSQVLTFTMHNPTNAYARPLAQQRLKAD